MRARYEQNNAGYDEIDGKYRCIHEIHWRLEEVYQIPDVDGQVTQLSEQEWEQLQERLTAMGMPVPEAAETMSRRYYEAWTVGSTVLQRGDYPMKSGFEYQAMTGLRDEDGAWYGLARPLMDPQRFANKTFTQIVGILNSNAKGGLIAESSVDVPCSCSAGAAAVVPCPSAPIAPAVVPGCWTAALSVGRMVTFGSTCTWSVGIGAS